MSWSLSSVEMIFWRSRTVFRACTRSRSRAAISNFSSAAAASIWAVSSWARPSFFPSRKRSTSRTVCSYPSWLSSPVQGALQRWM